MVGSNIELEYWNMEKEAPTVLKPGMMQTYKINACQIYAVTITALFSLFVISKILVLYSVYLKNCCFIPAVLQISWVGVVGIVGMVGGIGATVGMVGGIGATVGMVGGIGAIVGMVGGIGAIVDMVGGIGAIVDMVGGMGAIVVMVGGIGAIGVALGIRTRFRAKFLEMFIIPNVWVKFKEISKRNFTAGTYTLANSSAVAKIRIQNCDRDVMISWCSSIGKISQ
jgi:hypothetical protein